MNTLSMERAAVCLDCEVLFPVEARVCPACASESFKPLAAWLNREREEIAA